ncbi:MAG TPA: ATP-binding protein [Thermoanaerobaculia bacterium]|nr:ATP-binding protein [Thermoanaerobaculia bacterium]
MRTHPSSTPSLVRAVEDLPPEPAGSEEPEPRAHPRLAEARPLTPKSQEPPELAETMDAMGRLAGGVAHVFNNLLTVIAFQTELAMGALDSDHPARQHLREIEKAGQRGAALNRQLLAFSGRQVLHPRVLQLNDLVTGMEERMRRFLGEGIGLKLNLDPQLDRVSLDPEQLEQVIANLLSNSRDAMPEGGQVILETETVDVQPGDLTHPLRDAPGRWVLLRMCDTGPGMEEDLRRHAFEPFFTTKGGTEITGLGLSTAYGVVTQSGGHILAESDPGGGSRFLVFLPSVEAEASGTGAMGRDWETLLIVEDEENVRQPLVQILSARGYNVLAARDGAEAIRISQSYTGPIHLMVTDILMDGMSGVELADRLSFKRPEMRVLFATGYPGGLAESPSLGRPEDAPLLKKPFSGRELALKVREVLESGD